MILPFLVWNNLHSDKPVLYCTNASNFRTANRYGANVFNYVELDTEVMPIVSAAFWRHQAKKAVAYWTSIEYPQNVNYYLYRENSAILRILPIHFTVIGALFLAATIFFLPDTRKIWPLLFYTYLYVASIVAVFIIGRFRLPAVPAMIVLGTAFLLRILDLAREKSWKSWDVPKRRATVASLVLLPGFVLMSGPWRKPVETVNSLSSLSRQCFIALDLERYRECQQRILAFAFEIPCRNIAAVSAILGDPDAVRQSLALMAKHNFDPPYVDLVETQMILDMNIGKIPMAAWHDYLANAKKTGHPAQIYFAFLEAVRLRREWGFPLPDAATAALTDFQCARERRTGNSPVP
jgi:hypothetical protein